MSEAIPELSGLTPPPATPRDAAAVVLVRNGGAGLEVFWLRRGATVSFAGGFYAFPGGRLDEADARVPVEGATGDAATLRAAAARELLEETGILLAGGAERLSKEELAALRRELLAGGADFGALLRARGLSLRAADFQDAGRYVTPAYLPLRFDCRFFLAAAPPGAEASVIPGELAEGGWITPRAALTRWEEGTALLHPPNLHALQTLAIASSRSDVQRRLAAPPHLVDGVPTRVEFQKGIRLFALASLTLPPATHTNCYVLGHRELFVVDPGAQDDAEADRLVAFLSELRSEGMRPKAIVLTHLHQDHVRGAPRVRDALQLPILCHPLTRERLPWPVDDELRDGDVLEADGEPPMRFRVLHTPGHARGHICLLDERTRAAVVGDMVAGLGTILIDPPEGDMAEYLAQLARLQSQGVRALYPAHGPPIPDGPAKLAEYLAHRQAREAQVLAALGPSPRTLEEIAALAYEDTPAALPPIAERSAHAILLKLQREGRAACIGGRWARREA